MQKKRKCLGFGEIYDSRFMIYEWVQVPPKIAVAIFGGYVQRLSRATAEPFHQTRLYYQARLAKSYNFQYS